MRKLLSLIMIITLTIILSGCSDRVESQGESKTIENPRTDIETLQNWFPSLQGIESAEWEAVALGSSSQSRVPGPSSYQAKGIMILNDDVAKEYLSKYNWEEMDLQLDANTIDLSEYKDLTWYYSKEMEDELKPQYFLGKFYFSEKYIWFDVTR